eukprot:6207024-Pleurochrysis_carterae.AAC.1
MNYPPPAFPAIEICKGTAANCACTQGVRGQWRRYCFAACRACNSSLTRCTDRLTPCWDAGMALCIRYGIAYGCLKLTAVHGKKGGRAVLFEGYVNDAEKEVLKYVKQRLTVLETNYSNNITDALAGIVKRTVVARAYSPRRNWRRRRVCAAVSNVCGAIADVSFISACLVTAAFATAVSAACNPQARIPAQATRAVIRAAWA